MNAGKALDALVAEHVMGWKVLGRLGEMTPWTFEKPDGSLVTWEPTSFGSFRPSTDMAAAWAVVEHMDRNGWYWGIHHGRMEDMTTGCTAYFERSGTHNGTVSADTAPLAICKAALAAVGAEVPA